MYVHLRPMDHMSGSVHTRYVHCMLVISALLEVLLWGSRCFILVLEKEEEGAGQARRRTSEEV